MKKLVFFIPAILFTIIYGLLAIVSITSIHPIAIVLLIMFWSAGVLLYKKVIWGGLLGIIPAAVFIYMGTQDTGQIFSETPIGIVILLYYVVCICWIYKKNISKSGS